MIDGNTAVMMTAAHTAKLNGANQYVMAILKDKQWHTLFDLQKRISERTSTWYGETTISARIRDLRKPQYGSHVIEKKCEGKTFYYRLASNDE